MVGNDSTKFVIDPLGQVFLLEQSEQSYLLTLRSQFSYQTLRQRVYLHIPHREKSQCVTFYSPLNEKRAICLARFFFKYYLDVLLAEDTKDHNQKTNAIELFNNFYYPPVVTISQIAKGGVKQRKIANYVKTLGNLRLVIVINSCISSTFNMNSNKQAVTA